MPNLIQPNTVKIVTKEGEIIVSLQIDLNINLNQSGTTFTSNNSSGSGNSSSSNKKDDDFEWAIPDFQKSEKVNFGK
jgi:hypothetical protein